MFSLLPIEKKEKLASEYHKRLIGVLLFGLFFLFCAGIISYIPSYVRAVFQLKAVEKELLKTSDPVEVAKQEAYKKETNKTNYFAKSLSSKEEAMPIEEILNLFNKYRSGVKLTSFTIDKVIDATSTTITINGKALKRDDLINFSKNLREDGRFMNVDLPVSSLSRSKDINFSLILKTNI